MHSSQSTLFVTILPCATTARTTHAPHGSYVARRLSLCHGGRHVQLQAASEPSLATSAEPTRFPHNANECAIRQPQTCTITTTSSERCEPSTRCRGAQPQREAQPAPAASARRRVNRCHGRQARAAAGEHHVLERFRSCIGRGSGAILASGRFPLLVNQRCIHESRTRPTCVEAKRGCNRRPQGADDGQLGSARA